MTQRLSFALALALTLCAAASAQQTRWLWNGDHPAGTRLVSPEMGAAFTVPAGLTASFAWGYSHISMASKDGRLNATIWLVSSMPGSDVETYAVAEGWTDREGQPMPNQGARRGADGRVEMEFRSELDVCLSAWQPGPGGSGVCVYVWGSPTDEAALRAAYDSLLASAVHFEPSRRAEGWYGLRWLGWLGGMKLVYYDTYSSGDGSGYSSKWQIDLCFDGAFSQSNSFAANFGADVGSAAGYDPSQGVWGIDSHGVNATTLVMTAQTGVEKRYDVSYDPESERTYFGGYRYFCVPNDWCSRPDGAPALPQTLVQLVNKGGSKQGWASGLGKGAGTTSGIAEPRPDPAPAPEPAPSPAPPAAGAKGLDGTWVATSHGYALIFQGPRYEFHLWDGVSEWEFSDAGALKKNPRKLVFASDDSEVERYDYKLEGDALVLHLDGPVRFERQQDQ
jgi:hypothetical protein